MASVSNKFLFFLQRAIERGWFRKVRSMVAGAPNMAAVLSTAAEVAAAMGHLHEHNIIHGDLSNGNVLLCSSETDPRGFISKVTIHKNLEVLTSTQFTLSTIYLGVVCR